MNCESGFNFWVFIYLFKLLYLFILISFIHLCIYFYGLYQVWPEWISLLIDPTLECQLSFQLFRAVGYKVVPHYQRFCFDHTPDSQWLCPHSLQPVHQACQNTSRTHTHHTHTHTHTHTRTHTHTHTHTHTPHALTHTHMRYSLTHTYTSYALTHIIYTNTHINTICTNTHSIH